MLCFIKCVIDVTKLWTLSGKSQGSQLQNEGEKSVFDEHIEESLANKFFQVLKIINTYIISWFIYFIHSGMVTSGSNRTCCR